MFFSFRHLFKALGYSLAGIKRAWQGEQAFRIEVVILLAQIAVLCFLQPGAAWSAALLAGWLFVMGLELVNSAIEEVFDLVSPDYNIHAKHGKDMGSGAVFLAVLANGALWIGMLWGYVF